MRKGYLILNAAISDPALYDEYRILAKPSLERHGGKIIVRTEQAVAVEGECVPALLVIVEFATFAKAREHYESPEYQDALGKRLQAATCTALLVEGTDSPPGPVAPSLWSS
jgi:uncharacterized protein (DUF1330 family)